MRTPIPVLVAALIVGLARCSAVRVVGTEQTVIVGKTPITASGLDGYNALAVQVPDPNAPFVFINKNNILINEDPLYPERANGKVVIIWRLDASDSSPYSFPDDQAIQFRPSDGNPLPSNLDCGTMGQKKKAFACAYDAPDRPRKWKYGIRVKNATGTDPTPLDPWVHQN